MNHGLSEKTVNKIFSVFERFPEIEKAVLYGSRAKGNFKTGSDIDLTLYGEKLSSRLLGDIAEALDDLLLPYTIDLSIFDDLNHAKLREHIERVGVVFYEKKNQNMKAGWEIKTLGEVSKINYGYTESASNEPIGSKFLRITDIQDDGVNWETVPYCKIETNEITKYQLIENDIVFARTGATTGKSFLIKNSPPEAVFASYLIRLRLIDKKLLPEFLFLFFQSAYYWQSIKDGTAGSAQGGFNATKLAALSISIPPLPEQKRLVTLLDEAFESIATAKANAEQNLKNARTLFESHLNEVFAESWLNNELVKLADLATDITDGDHMPPPKFTSGVPFITIGNINKNTRIIDFSDTFMVSREYFDRLKINRKPKKGDVLYTVTGSFGVPVLLNENKEFCFQRHIGLVRPKSEVHSEWLYYLLMSPQIFKQANDGATGTAQKTVSLSLLRGFQVPRVPLEHQLPIIKKLNMLAEETQRLESLYSRKIAALDELKKALLHRAFSGEL